MIVRNLVATAIGNIEARFRFHQNVQRAINGGISFGVPSNIQLNNTNQSIPLHCENIDGVLVMVLDSGLANTDFAVTHNLGRIPQLYDVKRKSASFDLFDGTGPNTTTQMFFKCTVAHVAFTIHIH